MKKFFIIVISVLFVLFVVITLFRERSSPVNSENRETIGTLNEKENIQRFWEIYRQATENRIAGRYTKAVVDYEHALIFNNYHEDALYYLGNIYLELDNFKGAETAWKRLVQINPNSSRAHFQLGDLYLTINQKGLFNIDSAETEFKQAMAINKEETAPLLRLGQIALIRNYLSDAKNLFEAVTASNFKSVEAYFLNGYVSWKTGDRQKALNLLKRAAHVSQPVQTIHGTLGEGDTESRNLSGLSEESKHQPIFKNYYKDLSGLDSSSLTRQIDERYQHLDAFLEQIRNMTKSNTEGAAAID
jgi:tetratricopeptide (TPR) repeat protein